jgi:hypothetical protein
MEIEKNQKVSRMFQQKIFQELRLFIKSDIYIEHQQIDL